MTNIRRPTKASFVPARFDLIDHDGNHVTNESYAGNYVLVFFGFTQCKMVCPRALAKLSDVLDSLGERAERITALYITVDPERDTAAVMKAFLKQNYPRFTAERYVVPHSAITYVLGPDGMFFTHFTDATGASDMAHALARLP
jgi:protein SCO1/2